MRVPWNTFLRCALAVAILCVPAPSQKTAEPGKPEFDKAALEGYLRHLYAWGPEIKVELGEPKPSTVNGLNEVTLRASMGGQALDQVLYVSPDGKRFFSGTIYDTGRNPFQSELEKLATVSGPSLGTPGAPVVLVLFTDFQCPYCREQAKMIRANLVTAYPTQVRLYLKDFPLSQIHPWAKPAAIAGQCVYRQNPAAFWEFHDWIFDEQSQITAQNLRTKLMEFAEGKQLELLGLGRCVDDRETEAEVDRSLQLAQSLRVDSTPTFFINGRRVPSQMGWPQMKRIIDNELEYQKTANNAGDKPCCEVTLPSPLAK
ncbi:MAG: thioredoxin domain-containing protein [Bryobacteraceae bacterium]